MDALDGQAAADERMPGILDDDRSPKLSNM
jgi:hypothetical protein